MENNKEQNLIQEISELTLKIKTEFPELEKYLDETPNTIPNQGEEPDDISKLTEHRNWLTALIKKYK